MISRTGEIFVVSSTAVYSVAYIGRKCTFDRLFFPESCEQLMFSGIFTNWHDHFTLKTYFSQDKKKTADRSHGCELRTKRSELHLIYFLRTLNNVC